MSKKHINRRLSFHQMKSMYGRLFILPWVIGFVLFFFIPLLQSIYYSFADVKVGFNGFDTTFVGLTNYKYVWTNSLPFRNNLKESLVEFAYSLPVIVVLSLILAVILNQKFRGRLVARSIFFLPVIIATGVVIQIMNQDILASQLRGGGESNAYLYGSVNFISMLESLGLPQQTVDPIIGYLQGIFNLVWGCGVQIILFLAGLQSVPDYLYEVSEVEGATAWENFWFITLPMISNITILVIIYTVIDLFTNPDNKIMQQGYTMMQKQNYNRSSAILWSFFILVGLIAAVLMTVISRKFQKKWGD